jgi:hypothetical protein
MVKKKLLCMFILRDFTKESINHMGHGVLAIQDLVIINTLGIGVMGRETGLVRMLHIGCHYRSHQMKIDSYFYDMQIGISQKVIGNFPIDSPVISFTLNKYKHTDKIDIDDFIKRKTLNPVDYVFVNLSLESLIDWLITIKNNPESNEAMESFKSFQNIFTEIFINKLQRELENDN